MTDLDQNKFLPVARLIELLSELPPEVRVYPNRVGNLMLMTPEPQEIYLGYVDLTEAGQVVLNA